MEYNSDNYNNLKILVLRKWTDLPSTSFVSFSY